MSTVLVPYYRVDIDTVEFIRRFCSMVLSKKLISRQLSLHSVSAL